MRTAARLAIVYATARTDLISVTTTGACRTLLDGDELAERMCAVCCSLLGWNEPVVTVLLGWEPERAAAPGLPVRATGIVIHDSCAARGRFASA